MPDLSNTYELLQAAQSGDEQAFASLCEPHRAVLLTHCYQILGSLEDAEDTVQEALLRAWSSLKRFDGRSAFRTWLYRIATNLCIDQLRKRYRGSELALNFSESDPELRDGDNDFSAPSIDPFPDTLLPALEAEPETAYLMRESVNLAFMTLLHRLPARQRVILLLRDVLNWQAREVAEFLDTTELAVNSALVRARTAMHGTPESVLPAFQLQPQHSHDPHPALLTRYVDAWETRNIDAFMALLKEDALMTMPPYSLFYSGEQSIREFLMNVIFNPQVSWKLCQIAANNQTAFAAYLRVGNAPYTLAGLQLLTLDSKLVVHIDHHIIGLMPGTSEAIHPSWLRFFALPETLADDGGA